LQNEFKALNHDLCMFLGKMMDINNMQNKSLIVADFGKYLAT